MAEGWEDLDLESFTSGLFCDDDPGPTGEERGWGGWGLKEIAYK